MLIGNREFKKGRTYIMGILNVTPDSFSDGGSYEDPDKALLRAEEMLKEGADIIDVGGQSTRPGYKAVGAGEEIRRTVHIVERIKSELGALVSIDTYRAEVAKAAIEAGADIVNDVWGLKFDANMAGLIGLKKVTCVLMHNRKEPVGEGEYLRDGMTKDFESILRLAHESGITDDKIILDPGIGFGKTHEQNLQVLAAKDLMVPAGYPVLVGASRKSVIGKALDVPVEERLAGTVTTTLVAAMAGAMFVRVHDIKENYQALKMYNEIRSASFLT